ncbi:MAG TPA: ABC transporter ATP-binding protein [Actinomycetota bacterium]
MLKVEGLSHRFPGSEDLVLDDVSLEVPNGGFVSLIGPSGCGKTTLLRIVAGLLEPGGAGQVYVEGKLLLKPSPEKAMIFQHFNLLPWRTALANAAYGLELQRVPKAERRERALAKLKMVGLEAFVDHYPWQLSGGMQQRVGIARALAVEPKVLLMDEPFGSLDALTREYLQTELQKLCEETRVTVLFVTHSIDEAIYLSDRVYVMGTHPGRILEEIVVPLRRPRWTYNARGQREFGQLRDVLWGYLHHELAAHVEAGSEPIGYQE